MTQLDLFLPFALPPEEMARDLLRALDLPALALLLARGRRTERQASDGFARALPHEPRLARQFGLAGDAASSPPLAPALMRRFGLVPENGTWFILQPAHLHVAHDHLVLTDLRQLALSEAEARALFAAAQPLFEEAGKPLRYGDARTWFMRADDWTALRTSTPDAACGHNIDIWMPAGPHERDWRRLQNEVQMHWHMHAVNEARELDSRRPVNTLWLWGGGTTPAAPVPETAVFVPSADAGLYTDSYTDPYAALGAPRTAVSSAADMLRAPPPHAVLLLDELAGFALAGAWSEWLTVFHHYETTWFAPLRDALQGGLLDRLVLTLGNDRALAVHTVTRSSLRRFWRSPSLAALAS